MASSKVLCALLLLILAISGAAAQASILAACGPAVAVKLQGLAPKCTAGLKSAKTCPSACKSIISTIGSNKGCGAAVTKVTAKADAAKINTVCMHEHDG